MQSTDVRREHTQVCGTSVLSKNHGRAGVEEAIQKASVPKTSECPKGRGEEVMMRRRVQKHRAVETRQHEEEEATMCHLAKHL